LSDRAINCLLSSLILLAFARITPYDSAFAQQNLSAVTESQDVPVVHSKRLAGGVPLGGIGCGTFELLTDGTVTRATINNNWDRPIGDLKGCFASVWTNAGGKILARALQLTSPYKLPCISGIEYKGLFPQAFIDFPDRTLPINLSLRAVSPLVPHDVKNSSLPVAFFVFKITNESRAPVDASIALCWENFLGVGGTTVGGAFSDRTGNTLTAVPATEGIFGLKCLAPPLPSVLPTNRLRYNASSGASYALVSQAAGPDWTVTSGGWNALDSTPSWWTEFSKSGTVSGVFAAGKEGSVHPAGALAVKISLKDRESKEIAFAVSWYTPRLWTLGGQEYGHSYENGFEDAVQVARYALQNRLTLTALTDDWQKRLLRSSLPGWLTARLINDSSTLFTNTVLTQDNGLGGSQPGPGPFAMLESPADAGGTLGAMDHRIVSHGLLTSLFPSLSLAELRSFKEGQGTSGAIPRSVGNINQNIGGSPVPNSGGERRESAFTPIALQELGAGGPPDVSAGYAYQVYRYFQATGDQRFLDEFYPSAKHAIQFLGKLADRSDGLPAGPSVFDPKSTGVSSYNATVYLAALAAGRTMADQMTDRRFSAECSALGEAAKKSIVKSLWNGRYLREISIPTSERSALGQLAGQWMADSMGAGDLLPTDVITKSLENLLTLNDKASPLIPALFAEPDGRPSNATQSWPSYCAPYLAALLTRHGQADAGLAIMKKLHHVSVDILASPWGAPLAVDAATGKPIGNGRHMVSTASWSYFDAVLGFGLDVPKGRLTLSPKLPSTWKELSAPAFGPNLEGWLEYRPGRRATVSFRFDRFVQVAAKPTKQQTGTDLLIREVELPELPDSTEVTASLTRIPVPGKTIHSVGHTVFTFETPVKLVAGDRLVFAMRGQ
jgi:uncharacterized protein (DUF608 family)